MEARANTLRARATGRLPFFSMGGVLMLTVLVTLLFASGAWADTFAVTNTKDSGAGSLRAAIKGANYAAGADEVAFADGVDGTISLLSMLPTITDPEGLAIDGGGDVKVSGNRAVRAFEVGEGAALSLWNLTVADGLAFDRGGGVYNGGGTLTVEGSTFFSNGSDIYGGGIYNDEGGTLRVTNSTFYANHGGTGGGGGISNYSGTVG